MVILIFLKGKLSYLRSKQVSNYNLYKLGKRKRLQELLVSCKFEPLDAWLPPHYESATSVKQRAHEHQMRRSETTNKHSLLLSSLLSGSSSTGKISKNTSGDATSAMSQTIDKFNEHVVSDKAIADSVEAIIGAYLITSGPRAALQVESCWFIINFFLITERCIVDIL